MARCWTLCIEHIQHVAGQRFAGGKMWEEGVKQDCLFNVFSALAARDWLALLNWALSAHIAALKCLDG